MAKCKYGSNTVSTNMRRLSGVSRSSLKKYANAANGYRQIDQIAARRLLKSNPRGTSTKDVASKRGAKRSARSSTSATVATKPKGLSMEQARRLTNANGQQRNKLAKQFNAPGAKRLKKGDIYAGGGGMAWRKVGKSYVLVDL